MLVTVFVAHDNRTTPFARQNFIVPSEVRHNELAVVDCAWLLSGARHYTCT
jgi:hypothetical protein